MSKALWGIPRTDPSPTSSALTSLWSTQTIVSNAHFLSCFTEAKLLIKWKKLTTWWPGTQGPQAHWSPRIDKVKPYDTPPCYQQPISELCELLTVPRDSPASLCPENVRGIWTKIHQGVWNFWASPVLDSWYGTLQHCTLLHTTWSQ